MQSSQSDNRLLAADMNGSLMSRGTDSREYSPVETTERSLDHRFDLAIIQMFRRLRMHVQQIEPEVVLVRERFRHVRGRAEALQQSRMRRRER